jgi:protocatechuate 3,4-dioxygenase beta subunit
MQSQFFRGRRQLVPANMGPGMRTDDTGMYRISPLAPGEYLVMALFRETWVADDKDKQTLGYAPSYYPGTTTVAAAQRIKVVAGQEASAIDFSLVPGRAATISGTVVSADGSPLAGATVGVTQEVTGPGGSSMSMIGNTRAGADGTFKIRDVSPGQYILRASGGESERGSQTASLNLSVTGADIDGLILGADAGGLITGRVVTDSGVPLSGSPPTVTASSATFERSPLTVLPAEDGKVGADGRFLRRAATGPAFIRIGGLPLGWALKSVSIGGQDITTAPVEIRAGQTLSDVTIVISNRLPEVTGQVSDQNGRPADGPVLLFPADQERWHEAADAVRSARADQSGKFRFDRVRPGDYLIVAVAHMATWQQYDPEFLAPLRERSTKITVTGEPVTMDLKVVVR